MKKYFLFIALFLFSVMISFAQDYKIVTKTFEAVDSVKRYTIHIEYPEITGYPDADAQNVFNKKIYGDFQVVKDEFIKESGPENLISDEMMNELYAGYDLIFKNNDVISIIGNYYFYTGGAHGMPLVYSINYDLNKKKFFEIDDMFEGQYLKYISENSRKQLVKLLEDADKEWINGGTEPDAENFNCIIFNKDTVTIIFQSYQVAAYAFGQPEVTFLWNDLKQFIKKESVLWKLWKKN